MHPFPHRNLSNDHMEVLWLIQFKIPLNALIRKYGPALLEKLDAEEKCSEYDAEQTGQAA